MKNNFSLLNHLALNDFYFKEVHLSSKLYFSLLIAQQTNIDSSSHALFIEI